MHRFEIAVDILDFEYTPSLRSGLPAACNIELSQEMPAAASAENLQQISLLGCRAPRPPSGHPNCPKGTSSRVQSPAVFAKAHPPPVHPSSNRPRFAALPSVRSLREIAMLYIYCYNGYQVPRHPIAGQLLVDRMVSSSCRRWRMGRGMQCKRRTLPAVVPVSGLKRLLCPVRP